MRGTQRLRRRDLAAVALLGCLGLLALRPPFLPDGALTMPLGGRVLAFAAVAAIVTGLLFGLAPAVQFTRPDLVTELKDRTSQPAGRRVWFAPPEFPGSTIIMHKQPFDIWRIDYQLSWLQRWRQPRTKLRRQGIAEVY